MALTTRCLDCGTRTRGSRCATCQARLERHDDWTARRKIRSGWDWRDLRRQIIRRDRCCQHCGAQGPGVEYRVHHLVPLAEGGTNQLGNLLLFCRQCHNQAPAPRGGGNAPARSALLTSATAVTKSPLKLRRWQAE
jgi:5-methylcytosine-specific restriction endonuclease McrA